MQHTYSQHKIEHTDEFTFNLKAYSRFKFGDLQVAEKFGIELANGFIEKALAERHLGKQFVVISSPYSFIPTATFYMKNYFVYQFNKWLVAHNLPVAQEAKIHRSITYKEDYGELTAEERIRLIGNDRFHIDKVFVQDKVLVFLDDIKITGSHERMINKMINDYALRNDTYLLYYAELINQAIHPSIENYLNYYSVKNIFDLDGIVNMEGFAFNTRLVKYLLSADIKSFMIFIKNQSVDFLKLLYNMALGNSYHAIDAYHENLNALSMAIESVKADRHSLIHISK